MEALEILNEVNEQINRSRDYNFTVEIHFNKAYQARVERAIKELEALQNCNIKEKYEKQHKTI